MTETLKARLEKSGFAPDLKARTKRDVLRELADLLVSGGEISADAADDVFKALVEREDKMSTGMQFGVAIPHAKTDKARGLIAAVAVCRDGIDFKSMDGQPSNIFIVTISPPTDAGVHIRFLADISRFLASRTVRERVLAATTKDEMVAAFFGDSGAPDAGA